MSLQFPFTGLLRELISLGLLELIYRGIQLAQSKDINIRVSQALYGILESFRQQLYGVNSSKIVYNDKSAYFTKTKRLTKWYGSSEFPEDYIGLMFYVIENTARLLEDNKIDFISSFQSIKVGKEIILGKEFNNSLAIVPAIVKQAEFYEYQNEFLKPTGGVKPEILADPIWFTVMAIGFLKSFMGYYNKKYYFVTKEGVEASFGNPQLVRAFSGAISLISQAHMKIKPNPCFEELYNLRLSYDIASSNQAIESIVFPLKMYEVALVGNAYTCTRTMLIDLSDSISYMKEYISKLKSYGLAGLSVEIRLKNKTYENPMEALLSLAENEAQKPIPGDSSMLILTFIKDLYRVIHVRKRFLVEDTLLRLSRIANSLLLARNVDLFLKKTMQQFLDEKHLDIILSIGEIIER